MSTTRVLVADDHGVVRQGSGGAMLLRTLATTIVGASLGLVPWTRDSYHVSDITASLVVRVLDGTDSTQAGNIW